MARIAMPVADEFEDSELDVPRARLTEAGHEVVLIGERTGQSVRGKAGKVAATIDVSAADADSDDYDALVIPGGHSPDTLRMNADVVEFVRRFAQSGRPVAAVCHGPQLLIEADLVRGRTLTSWPSVRTDLENAGAHWVDQQVVKDGPYITSRRPSDLEAFSDAVLQALAQDHARST